MGNLGFPEMLFILLLALLIFGPKKLPELGKALGRGLAEFRRASNELRATIEDEVHSLEQETKPQLAPPDSPPSPAVETKAEAKSPETPH